MARQEIGLFLPHEKNVDGMNIDEFFDAWARAKITRRILRKLIHSAFSDEDE